MEFERLEHYNRLKTLFRIILAIPIVILRYVMGLLLEIGAVAGWFVILITGKMPRGLFDLMVLANSYTARSDSYLYLLTETYPPFQDEQTRAAGTPSPPPPAPRRRISVGFLARKSEAMDGTAHARSRRRAHAPAGAGPHAALRRSAPRRRIRPGHQLLHVGRMRRI